MNKKLGIYMKKNDIILIGVLLTISLVCIAYMYILRNRGKVAVLTYGDKKEARLSLNKDGIYDYESNGYTIHIEVKNHAAAFVQSPCPDHLCEHYGYLKDEGATAVCLPARAALTIRE